MSAVTVIFLVVFLGLLLGSVRFKGLSLDMAGVLIVAVLFGVIGSICPGTTILRDFLDTGDTAMNFLSALGTALFISAVGLESGFGLFSVKKRAVPFFLLGVGGVLINYVVLLLVTAFDPKIDPHFIRGVFCGAMTSTPGLASLSEYTGETSAVVGYGGAYFLGVILVVLFAQIFSRHIDLNPPPFQENTRSFRKTNGLMIVSAVIVLGCLLGEIHIPIIRFSLGNSGGILVIGILMGVCLQKKRREGLVSKDLTASLRLLGLMLFFVGSGIPAGKQLPQGMGIQSVFYGIIFTVIPILTGFFLAMLYTRGDKKQSLCAVCGIMTSTPAIGVLLRKGYTQPEDMAIYSVTYTGALLMIVMCMRI